jgi:MFS transporter, DHA3 family, macrolide efflux protein
MITADLAAAGLVGLGAWAFAVVGPTWVVAAPVAAGVAACTAFRLPAFSATIPLVVDEERLGNANAIVQMGQGLAQLLAPPAAGILLALGGLPTIIVLDGATFLISAALLSTVAIGRPVESEDGEALGTEFREGLRFLRSRSGLFHLMVLFSVSNFLLGMVEVLAAPMILEVTGPTTLGIVLALAGSGMLVGSIVMSTWKGPRALARAALVAMVAQGLCVVALGLRPNLVLIAAAGFGIFLAIPVDQTCTLTLFQKKVPQELQGRVFSLSTMLASVSVPFGYLLAGPLADGVFEPLLARDGALADSVGSIIGVGPGRGIAFLFCLVGLAFTAAALVGLRIRSIRDLDVVTPPPPTEAAPAVAEAI